MKTKLAGWKKICAFTYVQSMKSKAMKISMAILCGLALLSMPLISLISGSGDGDEKAQETSIEKVYVYDNTDLIGRQFADKAIESDVYGAVEYSFVENNQKESIEELINRDDNKNEVFLEIEYSDDDKSLSYGINVCVYYGKDSEVSKEDANDFSAFVDENVKTAILKSAGTSDEKIAQMSKDISYEVLSLDENGNPVENDEGISEFQYMFTLTFICVLIFMVSFVGGKVSELIVTEKATRVMEYILTSVKPMAILVGKVIGSTLIMLTMIVGMIISFVLSIFINTGLFPAEGGGIVLPSFISDMVENGTIAGITPVNVIVILILLFMGYLFYGLIAGIAGATVSKIEEMAEGMKIFTFTMMIGAYLPLFLTMTNSIGGSDWGVMSYVVYLLPISSAFILPQYLILGKVSVMLSLAAIGVLAVSIILVLFLVNKVYEHMLYSSGAALKVKDIIGMARSGKEEKNGK